MFPVTAATQKSSLYDDAHPAISVEQKDRKLVHLCLVHRHGERTPISGQDLNRAFKAQTPWRSYLLSSTSELPFTLTPKQRGEEGGSRPQSQQEERLHQIIHGGGPNPPSVTPCLANRRRTVHPTEQSSSRGSVDVVGGGAAFCANTEHDDDAASDVRGQLTRLGRQRMTAFGRRLRERYADVTLFILIHRQEVGIDVTQFLPKRFDASQCYLRSTDVPRTVQSLGCVLEGLFDWSDEKSRDSVHVETMPLSEETMVLSPTICASYHDAMKAYVEEKLDPILREKETVQILDHFGAMRGMTSAAEMPTDEAFELINDIVDVALARLGHDECIDEVIQRDAFDRLETLHRLRRFGKLSESKACIKHAIGAFLQELLHIFHAVQHKEAYRPLCIFSAHDGTIGRLLVALGFDEQRWPAFCANIVFEIFQVGPTDYDVQIRYNERLLTLPFTSDGATSAPLQTLIAYLEDILSQPGE